MMIKVEDTRRERILKFEIKKDNTAGEIIDVMLKFLDFKEYEPRPYALSLGEHTLNSNITLEEIVKKYDLKKTDRFRLKYATNRWGVSPEEAQIIVDLNQEVEKEIPLVEEVNLQFGVKIKGGHIVGLNLGNCKIKATIPEKIFELDSLKFLYLQNNQLKTLSKSLLDLKMLEILDVNRNPLEPKAKAIIRALEQRGVEVKASVKYFVKSDQARVLHLIENQMEDYIPLRAGIVENKQIVELNLDSKGLETLPDSIGALKSLKTLILTRNKLINLPESFGTLKALQELSLHDNKLTKLPENFWGLKDLKTLWLGKNPWQGEYQKIISENSDYRGQVTNISEILDYCRRIANISIFLSHAVANFETFQIKEIAEYLEQLEEIYDVYYCEADLKGNIDDFMDENIPRCQLVLIFASQKSIFDSQDCAHELELARRHNIQIIPIRGRDVSWDDLAEVQLSRELGFQFEESHFTEFCAKLYDYIKEFKRSLNIFEAEELKLDKEKLNLKYVINDFIESEEFEVNLKENFSQFQALFQKLNKNKISISDYILKWGQILNKGNEERELNEQRGS